jgi:hypothetical protein
VLKRHLLRAYSRPAFGPVARAALPLFLAYTKLRYRFLAGRAAREIADYVASGFTVAGVVGVGVSPSCGVTTTLDLAPMLEAVAGCPLARLDRGAMNEAVAAHARPGRGLFIAALAGALAGRGLEIPVLEHDLRSEWPGAERTTGARPVGVTRPRRSARPSGALLSATRHVLSRQLDGAAVESVVALALVRRERLARCVPPGLNWGGRHLLDLGTFTIGVHESLVGRGVEPRDATGWVADIVEEANGPALDWLHRAGMVRHRDPLRRLRWESRLLCRLYYARPAWLLDEVPVPAGYGLDIKRCAIADFYRQLGRGGLCEQTICVQDERVARRYGASAGIAFQRTGTLAGGADRCDFRYVITTP